MKNIKINEINSLMLVLFIYITAFSIFLSINFNEYYSKNIIVISISLTLLILNKFYLNKKILIYITFVTIFIMINALLSPVTEYVLADGFNIIIYSFIPIYVLGMKSLNVGKLVEIWTKVSILVTLFLPLLYYMEYLGYASYYEIGFISYLNMIIVLVQYKNLTFTLKTVGIINLIFIAVFGSRMVFASILFTLIVVFFVAQYKNSIKYYIKFFAASSLIIFVYINLVTLLEKLHFYLLTQGINSRNLSLFISQLKGTASNEDVLSGRQDIYPLITEYILNNGFFPSGLGMARYLTSGYFYHAHNFFLELTLIFGYFITFILLVLFFYKIYIMYQNRFTNEGDLKLTLTLILLLTFTIRSITGTYFATDVAFLTLLGLVIGFDRTTTANEVYLKRR